MPRRSVRDLRCRRRGAHRRRTSFDCLCLVSCDRHARRARRSLFSPAAASPPIPSAWRRHFSKEPFAAMDRSWYAPFCLLLAARVRPFCMASNDCEGGHDDPNGPLARRRRRPGRLRQDRADGRALQAVARPLRDRRHHQRHLHEMGRRISRALRRARARTHRGRRDRRLPAYGHPRGCLDQSRRDGRDAQPNSPTSISC